MKKTKKVISSLLAATMALALVAPVRSTAEEPDKTMRLWYDKPASQTAASSLNENGVWQSATLPIGNGKLGANIYGEVAKEHLTLNEETLWSGGNYSSSYPGGNKQLDDSVWTSMVNTIMNGGSVDTSNLLGAGKKNADGGYYNGYQALGDLYFDFGSSSSSDYSRELNLDEGLATVSYSGYTRTYFASNPDNVIVAHFAGKSLSFTVSMTSKQNGTLSAKTDNGIGYITCAGTVSNNGLNHNTQIAVVPASGSVSVSGTGIKVTNATEVTVYVTAATDYSKDFKSSTGTEYYYRTGETAAKLSSRVKGVLDAAVEKGYANVLAEHQSDYKALYTAASVDLGGSSDKTTDALLTAYKHGDASDVEKRYLETLQYQYGRYRLIAGSRDNSQLPTTLQGIWNNNNAAPWYSDIHTNINLQMNYWLAGTSNLTSCLKPLANYMKAMYTPGNKTVQAYTDATDGMMMHTQNTPFGYTCPGWEYSWGWSPSASTWLLQNCYDYYQYTGDVDYLKNTLYPLMENQVKMYDDLLVDKDGERVFPLSISPEVGGLTYGNTYEQSLIWQLYTDTIDAAKALGKGDDEIAKMEDTRSKLYTNFVGTTTTTYNGVASGSSYIKEWYSESDYYGSYTSDDYRNHRHISQMLGIFPGSMLGSISGSYETDKTAAINTLKLRGKNTVSGWSLAQRACTWAALGDGANAYDYLSTVLTNGVMTNLWGYHDYGTYGGDGKAFQIDANYGYSAAFGEMLLQSNMGYIDVLPAIPKEWSSGSFSGLLAEGNFAVSAVWADSKPTSLTIKSNNGGTCSVKTKMDNAVVKDSNGKTVDATTDDNGVLTFATDKDSTYTISEPAPAPALNLQAKRNADGSVTLKWDAVEGVTYKIYRKEVNTTSN